MVHITTEEVMEKIDMCQTIFGKQINLAGWIWKGFKLTLARRFIQGFSERSFFVWGTDSVGGNRTSGNE